MSAFAVAAFHDAELAAGSTAVEAVVWIRAAGIADSGAQVALRLWTPVGARIGALREIAPGSADLLPGAVRRDDRTVECAAGAWSDGVHEYELTIEVPAREPGEQLLAARVSVIAEGEVAGRALIAVTWTDAAPAGVDAATPATPATVGRGAPATGGAAAARGGGGGIPREATARGGGGGASGAVDGLACPPGTPQDPTAPLARAAAEIPTGPSPHPRRGAADATARGGGEPCTGCGARPADGDRFCEACGRELAGSPPP